MVERPQISPPPCESVCLIESTAMTKRVIAGNLVIGLLKNSLRWWREHCRILYTPIYIYIIYICLCVFVCEIKLFVFVNFVCGFKDHGFSKGKS